MAMMAELFDEYGQVVRVEVDTDREIPWCDGYIFVGETKPLEARVYCREITLARGRILYEVKLRRTGSTIGYSVPREILEEAKAYRSGSVLKSWTEEPYSIRQVLQGAHEMVLEQFPRIPSYSARMVAQEFKRESITPRKAEIEGAVVAHAQKSYTSFKYRVRDLGEREADVLKLIRSRMREMLESWLPRDVLSSKLRSIFRTYHLEEEREDGPGTTLTNFDGAESLGNIRSYESGRFA
ncbi:hypothetical protein LTR86_010017 [Recurvomyces mirabilis]|nr:hypothetical protein LTR86_010017 [Recurvomyces mirabilis]